MTLALEEARLALDHDDVPVGAVVLRDGHVLARRHNERELLADPTAHAELLAMRDAAAAVGRWRLDDCTLVVTLEPCVMCAGAVVNARIGQLVFGATTRRPAPSAASTTSLPTPGSTTACRSSAASGQRSAATCCGRSSPNGDEHPNPRPLASPTGRMPERTNGTASKAVEVLRASVGSNPTPSAFRAFAIPVCSPTFAELLLVALIVPRRLSGRWRCSGRSARRWGTGRCRRCGRSRRRRRSARPHTAASTWWQKQ